MEWYQNISKSKDAGTKLMGFSGRVKNPGLWELPFGTTAREILEDYAGGMRDGLKFKAWQPGGAGTDFLTEAHLLRALERGEGQPGDIETLEQLCRFLGPGKTFCAHAPGAVEPLQSAIKYFREEFEAGIKQPFSNTHLINGIQPNLLKERW